MRTKLTASLATLALSGAFLAGVAAPSNAATPTVAPAASTQAPRATAGTVDVLTTFTNGNVLSGTFTPTSFVNQGGTLTAIGTFTGTLKDASGAVLQQFINTATSAAVTNAATPGGSCTILDLTLGPLNLNLLGLVVQTNQIHLTITAQQGNGNLLGNLLCSVANLLNNGVPGLNGLANLLNQLLGL